MSELHAEQDDSGRAEYEEYCYLKAEAEKRQVAYLEFLKLIPCAYERDAEQQRQADEMDWLCVLANRKLRAAEFELKWANRA